MNSRDSAYDEAEQLRRAIEESKKDSSAAGAPGARKGKRSRSESEGLEAPPVRNPHVLADSTCSEANNPKRRRTESGSSSNQSRNRPQAGSEEEDVKEEKPKNIRGAAARNHKAKQERERVASRDAERNDKAGKRKVRSEKRKSDGTHHPPQRDFPKCANYDHSQRVRSVPGTCQQA